MFTEFLNYVVEKKVVANFLRCQLSHHYPHVFIMFSDYYISLKYATFPSVGKNRFFLTQRPII